MNVNTFQKRYQFDAAFGEDMLHSGCRKCCGMFSDADAGMVLCDQNHPCSVGREDATLYRSARCSDAPERVWLPHAAEL